MDAVGICRTTEIDGSFDCRGEKSERLAGAESACLESLTLRFGRGQPGKKGRGTFRSGERRRGQKTPGNDLSVVPGRSFLGSSRPRAVNDRSELTSGGQEIGFPWFTVGAPSGSWTGRYREMGCLVHRDEQASMYRSTVISRHADSSEAVLKILFVGARFHEHI